MAEKLTTTVEPIDLINTWGLTVCVNQNELLNCLLNDENCKEDVFLFQSRQKYPFRSDEEKEDG